MTTMTCRKPRRLRAPLTLLALISACSLLAPPEDYFGGEPSHSGGAATSGGRNAGGEGGGNTQTAGADSETGGVAGAGMGGSKADAGAPGAGAGGQSGGGHSSDGGHSGAGGHSGVSGHSSVGGESGAGGVSVGSGGSGTGGASCNLPPTKMEMAACGACNTGTQSRTLTLNSACAYVAGDWSPCSGVTAACTPGNTSACANGDSCGHRVCSDSCTWGGCVPRAAGGCLRIRAGSTVQGSNFRCCGSAGHWQFCLPSCNWSADCASCSQGAPDYCSECY